LTVLNDAINRYKMQGGELAALTAGKPFANLLTKLQTPVTWNGLTHQFLKDNDDFPNALTIDALGSRSTYRLTRFNDYNEGGGGNIVSGGEDTTSIEFNIEGATYYAVAPAGYSYTAEQTSYYSTRKYNTPTAAEAALPANPTTPLVINILGSWSTASSTLDINGVATSATNYLLVRTIGEARHNGAWDTSAHRFVVTNTPGVRTYVPYVILDGLQAQMNVSSSGYNYAFYVRQEVTSGWIRMNACIAWANVSSNNDVICFSLGDPPVQNTLTNCVAYGALSTANNQGTGYYAHSKNVTIQNCVAYNCWRGIEAGFTNTVTVQNTIVQNCNNMTYRGTFNGSSNYNASDVVNDRPGANSVTGTVQFVNAGSGDFHLASGDTVAKGAGMDLSGSFTQDIDGDTRTAPWNIGADE